MNEIQSTNEKAEITIEEAQTVRVEAKPSANSGLPLAIFLGLALIAAAIFFGPNAVKSPSSESAPSLPSGATTGIGDTTAPTGPVNVTAGDLPALGDPKANVLVVEWGDYQCPFCERFFQQVEPTLREQYIKTGKVLFAFRDFQFLGQESTDAGIAARCADEQGKFWAYHDKLYKEQKGENQGTFAKANLKKFAADIGLNTTQFNNCLDTDKYKDAAEKDTAAGRDAGVNGTPTTFINGRVVNGAQPLENFTKIIEEELTK